MVATLDLRKYRRLVTICLAVVTASVFVVFLFGQLYPMKYTEYIFEYAKEYNIDPVLLCAVINVESNFDKDAASHKGAKGLMQLMEPTADWGAEKIGLENFTFDQLGDPETNIRIGSWYLSTLGKQYNQDLELMLTAYNAGSGNVSKWLKDARYSKDGATLHYVPYAETRNYIRRVMNNMYVYRFRIEA